MAEVDGKIVTVQPELVDLDLGNLTAVDSNLILQNELRQNSEKYFNELARDNCQILFNKIWELPIERVEEAVVVVLPEGSAVVPREKFLPKAHQITKWEQFAQMKGITKKKKERKVWDVEKKEWRPSWGYKRVNDKKDEWFKEVPDQADPLTDMFEKETKAKNERVAKNEFQRLRNVARVNKRSIHLPPPKKSSVPSNSEEAARMVHHAKLATVSRGRMLNKLPGEKPRLKREKRKFKSNFGDMASEKSRTLAIISSLNIKPTAPNLTVHVNKELQKQQTHQRGHTKRKFGNRSQKSEDKKSGGTSRKFNNDSKATSNKFKQNKRGRSTEGKTKNHSKS